MFRGRSIPRPSRRSVIVASSALALTSTYYLASSQKLEAESIPVTKRRPGPLWAPPSRSQMLEHLKTSGRYVHRTDEEGGPVPGPVLLKDENTPDGSEEDGDVFDLIIIGGGATGAGTAVDAASRGLKVACVERDDFASGTSSKSTKLVHGGVRYLQKAIFELDYGECIELKLDRRMTNGNRTMETCQRGSQRTTSLPGDCPSSLLYASVSEHNTSLY